MLPGIVMYLDISRLRRNGRNYQRVLLRESYRENGKVKKRTIANVSACSDEEIEAMRLALRNKGDLEQVGSLKESVSLQQGPSIGAVWLVYTVARRLGIAGALGSSRAGKLALWQVIARVIDQGSRLSAVRLAGNHAACDVLDLDAFHEDHLYENLDWICAQQFEVENKLFRQLHGEENADLFLYDVTSSYLEGKHNAFAAFGYCRDGKKGKRQIVVGLLCDRQGIPVSIEVFKGNTQDTKTFGHQVTKVAERFGGGSVTFVGDRGMIKGPQIEELKAYKEHEFHYITAITKPQIEKLLAQGDIQIGLFDQELAEVEMDDGPRYVLRRNPARTKETQQGREDKLRSLRQTINEQNLYLKKHLRAGVETALRKIESKSKELKIDGWVNISSQQRSISLSKDLEQLKEVAKLDGCYVLKTDLSPSVASKDVIHHRYKDLALVEWAFRTSKTVHLERRPIHVRLETRTRAHAFVVMMAYRIIKELAACWKPLDITVEEGMDELDNLCLTEISVTGKSRYHSVPDPRPLSRKLLEAAQVKLPSILPSKGVTVATKKKLPSRRTAA